MPVSASVECRSLAAARVLRELAPVLRPADGGTNGLPSVTATSKSRSSATARCVSATACCCVTTWAAGSRQDSPPAWQDAHTLELAAECRVCKYIL